MRALAILVVLATSGVAHAQMLGSFGSWMHYELSELHAVDESMTSTSKVQGGGTKKKS